jgi:predicted XRE-type DNA-binding protein
MDKETQKRLEAAGFRVGDAEDFLGLTDDERRLVELRLTVSRTVRRLREQQGMTQQQLAAKLKSSQSRVAKVEAAARDVSLDLSVRALFAAGGSLSDLVSSAQSQSRGGKKANRGSRPRKVRIDRIGTEL